MRQLPASLVIALVMAGPALAADVLKPYKVTFRTTDCAGDTGMASVEVDRIEKIRGVDCGPDKSGLRLKQVLVRPRPTAPGYEVFMVTAEDAGKIEKQIDEYMEARKRTLEGGKTLIIEH
jgi:hypothetical protein